MAKLGFAYDQDSDRARFCQILISQGNYISCCFILKSCLTTKVCSNIASNVFSQLSIRWWHCTTQCYVVLLARLTNLRHKENIIYYSILGAFSIHNSVHIRIFLMGQPAYKQNEVPTAEMRSKDT